MSESKFLNFAGLVGIIAPIFAISAVIVSTLLCGAGCGPETKASYRWGSGGRFSWRSNALSDLGVSEVAHIFNNSLILVGLLNFIFGIGFVQAYSKGMLFYLGGILLVLGGVSLSLVGVFTEDYGVLHLYVSLGYFILFPTAMMLAGLAFTRMNMRTKGYISILAGLIALLVIVGGLTIMWHIRLDLGFAVPEFIEAIVISGWIVWMALSLFRPSQPSMDRSSARAKALSQ